MNDVTISLITAIAGGIPAVIAVVLSNRSHDKVIDERMKHTDERITELSTRVNKHNNLIERMVKVEESTKSAHHRLDDIVDQLKITENRRGR